MEFLPLESVDNLCITILLDSLINDIISESIKEVQCLKSVERIAQAVQTVALTVPEKEA